MELRTFGSALIAILMMCCTSRVLSLQVDNQLVSPRKDCFERIAVGAMLPVEKTFRNSDIDSIRSCQELCIQEGEKCQSLAVGIHVRRGNGTCQLSEEKIDESMTRPAGTIFDPDFDLYVRKQNCFDIPESENAIPPNIIGMPSMPGRLPLPFGPVNSVSGLPQQPPSVQPTATTFADSTDDRYTPNINDRTPTTNGDHHYPTTIYDNRFSNRDHDRPPSNGYHVEEEEYPTPADKENYPIRGTTSPYNGYDNQNRDQIYYSHDLYPLYKYPMLYEQNYPSPNDQSGYPKIYAQNVPSIQDHYRPSTYTPGNNRPHTTPRPIYGLGYGSSFSYGPPTSYEITPRPDYSQNDRPTPSYGYRPAMNGNNYYDDNRPKPNKQDSPVSVRPLDNDYMHRPDPSYSPTKDGVSQPGYSGNIKPSDQHNNKPQEGNYHRMSGEPIETYFNPEDYFQLKWTPKPGNHFGGTEGYGNKWHTDNYRACFRRVLAGKRIAPHWVRRTLACERVEDCMHECGHEKRFTCEGFNYRLDPSGHGQGDCELIEVPLSQIDLYSSTQSRDANLLRHPDYDYYERDRNAPSSCRQACTDCGGVKPISSPPIYYRPVHDKPAYIEEHYVPPPSSSDYGGGGTFNKYRPSDTAIDKYRPPPHVYDSRPPPPSDYHHHYDFSSQPYYESDDYNKPSSGGGHDRYDVIRPADYRPDRWEVQIPSSHDTRYGVHEYEDDLHHHHHDSQEYFRPPYRPGSDYSPYRPHHESGDYHHHPPPPPSRLPHNYLNRDGPSYRKPSRFIPYLISSENDWGSYGGSYGGGSRGPASDYWGLKNDHRRKDDFEFNYFDLGGRHKIDAPEDNHIWSYPGTRYGHSDPYPGKDRPDYESQWTRRPGPDECSVKFSEGFRIHKGAVRHSYKAPTVTECERFCVNEDKFICHTYSYKYSTITNDNCLLCDRPVHQLDYYVDIEPNRDYDIYSVTDDQKSCRLPPEESTALSDNKSNTQCFFRAIDASRFFESIVRDSLNVRSIGECELECIKSSKFTCRAFSFRYGQKTPGGIIDNCQLTDWPVRETDKERHLIPDPSFDIFERASYGHGCEIQPIVDDKHKKLCYLGYGSPAKLLSTAIKKVISVPTELECKKECIRYRDNTPFKCYSFSFGSHASTFNCEMSDLDQSELKLNIHYTHTHDRDYWLFAWNPFDWTCRDKVLTIGGKRINNDRRMDIFSEPGVVTWRHYTVSGKPCRVESGCEKNLVSGFYSCEIEGGEIGSWDYCCKADYPCGYSRGFDYPWCFVGDEPDQWRKCSDRYFPGNHTQLPSAIIYTTKGKRKKNHYQHPPQPGGLQSLNDFTAARLWPVTYLYSEGPPNSTELSNFVDCNKDTC